MESLKYIFRGVFFIVLLIFTNTSPVQAQGADVNKIRQTFYVSSSMGDDANDGLTEYSSKQHIYAIRHKENIRILLKRGDVFYEQLLDFTNCIIEGYGRGDRPVLCGFKVLMNPQAWIYDELEGLWYIDLMDEGNFAGCLHGDVTDDRINNIGFIYNPNGDKVYGRRVRVLNDLKENGSFFLTNQFVLDSINNDSFRYLRWKYDGNPRKIKHLCFPMWLIAVKNLNNCELRNISIVGFNFGIVVSNSTVVDNCQIDLIGGAVQLGTSSWVRYGNGIEYAWSNFDNLVTNCLISRTYDCGTSIQSSGIFNGSPKNIHFVGNKFYRCRQAFEFFLNAKNDYKPQYENCSFTDNVCFLMGENEFSTPQLRDANILSYDGTVKSIKIESNTFWGAPYFCGAVFPNGLHNNTVYVFEKQYLYNYHGQRTMPVVIADGDQEIEKFRKQSGDDSKIFIMKKGSRFTRQMEKKIKKNVSWKPVNLKLERLSKD